MDPATKAQLLQQGGKLAGDLVRLAMSRPHKSTPEKEEERQAPSTELAPPQYVQQLQPAAAVVAPLASRVPLATSEETTTELKRRLAKELYRAELDLAAGLKIAQRPCDCLSQKHALMLEAAAEELISQDPDNSPVYQEIINWIPRNSSKVSPEAIQSGEYAAEYPYMANEFKNFRKRVMGSVGTTESTGGSFTLDEAKKMAAEEAVKEVERAWKLEG